MHGKKVKIRYLSVISIILLIGFTYIKAKESKKDYPVIVLKLEVIDKETKMDISNVKCIIETYHEHVECQPEFSAKKNLDVYTSLLKKDSLFEIEGKSIRNEMDKIRRQIEVEKKKNEIPRLDTTIINSQYSLTYPKPFKKYKIQLSHKDYKTVEFRDSFPICETAIFIQAELRKK